MLALVMVLPTTRGVVEIKARLAWAPDWLSTSVALKSHSGRNTPGLVDASLTALIVSFCEVKYDCSVCSPLLTVAGTLTPFGSTTAACAVSVASPAPMTHDSIIGIHVWLMAKRVIGRVPTGSPTYLCPPAGVRSSNLMGSLTKADRSGGGGRTRGPLHGLR